MIVRYSLQAISWLALAATILPSLAFLGGRLPLDTAQSIMLLATIVWFTATPFWMGTGKEEASESDQVVVP
jgi:hypothetical protein